MSNKITRGISEKFAKAFVDSKLYSLYDANREDLFLGVRNEYINLYYKAASVCKLKSGLNCEVAKKYIFGEGKKYTTVSIETILEKYECIKNAIDGIASTRADEKKAQQQLIYLNNSNGDSKWFCIDIEYVKERNHKGETTYGRFDIIAISKEKPHIVALIELKYGSKAIGGKSGILKHVKDYANFIRDQIFLTHMRKEIAAIVESLNWLNACNIKIDNENDIACVPEFYFITLNNEDNKALKTMRRYVLQNEYGASIHTVEKELGIDITKQNKMNFTPSFLFSDRTIKNNDIDDIIESNLYTMGL